MIDEWATEGVRPMVYMNPYFANLTGHSDIRENLFKQADGCGFFLKNSTNQTYLIDSLSIKFGMIDFSNPQGK
jgi:alpha-glucosidase (family GH31 glycosyl hydrolase)